MIQIETNLVTANPEIVLSDVSLAAIVRDEMMNPAGGIIDFVESTVPHVEQAVIVDTGSVDGTREMLEELQARYPNLVILDRPFDDYASSRNISLKNVKTKYAFVLDADERLTREDFAKLQESFPLSCDGLNFSLMTILPNPHENVPYESIHNPRLFLNEGVYYCNRFFRKYIERLCVYGGRMAMEKMNIKTTKVNIKHFWAGNLDMWEQKREEWYKQVVDLGNPSQIAPSQVASSQQWKAYNPRREEFR